MALDLARSVRVPLSRAEAFDHAFTADLTRLFDRRAGLMPAVRAVEDVDGSWGAVGDTRRVQTADGNSTLETLVEHDRPATYAYELSEITGPFALLVSRVEGRFTFVEADGGTTTTWSWRLHARTPLAVPALHLVGLSWRRWAARALDRLARSAVERTA
jgi:hypothetical protein